MLTHSLLKGACGIVTATAIAMLATQAGAAGAAFEQLPLTLPTADFLAKPLLSGEGYSVDKVISSGGFQNTYSLKSKYGDFTVTGTAAVLARIQEIKATQALQKLEESDEFKDAAKGALTGMVAGGKALLSSPVETTKGAAKGIGRWFNNMGDSINSDDPHQDNVLETAVGYDAVKRSYAVEMGIDPYTDFQPFQQYLAEVAKASTAGAMITSMAINVGTAGTAAGTVTTVAKVASMKNLLKDNPPSSLSMINKEKLLKMGIVEHNADALLKNYNYSPAQITVLVEALVQMGDTQGRDVIVAYATSAPDENVALFNMQHTVMLQRYITEVGPAKVIAAAGAAWLVSDAGSMVGAFPSDYLAWTQGVATATAKASEKALELDLKRKELLLKGPVSTRASAALIANGWGITENAQFANPERVAGK
jgi:hypothetical protein